MTPFCLSSAGARQSTMTVLELKGLAATSLGSPGTGQGQEVRREARTGDIVDRNTTPQQTALSSTDIHWRKGKRYCIYYIAMRDLETAEMRSTFTMVQNVKLAIV